jgi:ribonuclease HI
MPPHLPPSLVVAHIDGASRGNPGPAAYGIVLEIEDGAPIAALSKTLGQTTNNVAEYHALLAALEYALENKVRRLKVLTDSELMARQIQGAYKVRSLELIPLYEHARSAIAKLESFSIQHVLREQNRQADRLANEALDKAAGITSTKHITAPGSPAPAKTMRASAIYHRGNFELGRELSLKEGEKVELEIRRKT